MRNNGDEWAEERIGMRPAADGWPAALTGVPSPDAATPGHRRAPRRDRHSDV
jgi:hypothetical protein